MHYECVYTLVGYLVSMNFCIHKSLPAVINLRRCHQCLEVNHAIAVIGYTCMYFVSRDELILVLILVNQMLICTSDIGKVNYKQVLTFILSPCS